MLVDSHCHLDFDGLREDLDGVLARADAAGVATLVTICTKVTEFERVLNIAEDHDRVWCTVGIHPHNAESEPQTSAEELMRLAEHPKVVGIGETGLDYFYDHSPHDVQQRAFREHIRASRETGLPLIVHSRDADEDMARILSEEMAKGAFPGLMHCFSSGPELAQTAVDIGMYISLSGIITFKKADEVRDIAKSVSLTRLLVETDAPYLAPVPHRGETNEPSFVRHTADKLAEIKDVSPTQIDIATTTNFFELFSKVERPSPESAA
jgi:TatD DNase family protein